MVTRPSSATRSQCEINKARKDAIAALTEIRDGFTAFLKYFGGCTVSDAPSLRTPLKRAELKITIDWVQNARQNLERSAARQTALELGELNAFEPFYRSYSQKSCKEA